MKARRQYVTGTSNKYQASSFTCPGDIPGPSRAAGRRSGSGTMAWNGGAARYANAATNFAIRITGVSRGAGFCGWSGSARRVERCVRRTLHEKMADSYRVGRPAETAADAAVSRVTYEPRFYTGRRNVATRALVRNSTPLLASSPTRLIFQC